MSDITPIHPGEHLQEILAELGISGNRLAQAAGIPTAQVGELVGGNRPVTADTALRIGKALGMSPEFWLNLQGMYDLEQARSVVDVSGIRTVVAVG